MDWLEITLNAAPEELDGLTDRLTGLGVEGIITEDAAVYLDFLENNHQYWDYVDESVMESVKGVSRLKFYLEDSPAGAAELRYIAAGLPGYELISRRVKDEDWENNWKQYYEPIRVGKRLLIVPQ